MIGYRRKSFNQVYTLLREIARSPQDIPSVLACQRILLREILRAEAHISRHKDNLRTTRITLKTSRPNKPEAQRLKQRVKWLKNRIEAYRHLIYIWRCFGDGIAFCKLDTYAVKHAFYETETYAIKQDAGFISGKNGLANEIELVEAAARAGVPSILVDLTNSIRHGDVCLLGGSDPYLIEVKSGKGLNKRGKRQVASIDKIHAFYQTDQATDLHGEFEAWRLSHHASERRYVDELNSCIDHAERNGLCVVNPESGLYYAAIYEAKGAVQSMFEVMEFESPLLFSLNEFKRNCNWSPYRPFTLSIYKQHHLYNFIQGELSLFVILDIAVLYRQLTAQGLEVTYDHDADFPLKYTDLSIDCSAGISRHILQRTGLEFLSPKWIIDCQAHVLEQLRDRLHTEGSSA